MEKKEKADLTHSRPFPHPAAPYWERDTAIRNLSNLLDKYENYGLIGLKLDEELTAIG